MIDNRRIRTLIGPLKLVRLFHLESIGKQFLKIISNFADPINTGKHSEQEFVRETSFDDNSDAVVFVVVESGCC